LTGRGGGGRSSRKGEIVPSNATRVVDQEEDGKFMKKKPDGILRITVGGQERLGKERSHEKPGDLPYLNLTGRNEKNRSNYTIEVGRGESYYPDRKKTTEEEEYG